MIKRASVFLVSLLVLAVLAVGIMFARNRTTGTFQVMNSSGEQIERVTIEVSDQTFIFRDLAPQEARTESFRIGKDSHYDVSVKFETGRNLEATIGYVTSGIDSADNIVILGSQVRIESQ